MQARFSLSGSVNRKANKCDAINRGPRHVRFRSHENADASGLMDAGLERPLKPQAMILGLVTRKQRWGLSWRGWLIAVVVAMFAAGLAVKNIYPFLAVTDRVDAKILVVEGWVHQYAIDASLREINAGQYERIFTTGGPVIGTGGYTSDFNTTASVGADRLKAVGVPDELLQMVPCREAGKDRTFSSAVALREWLRQHNMTVQGINVVTEDTHARRTRLLFEKAFQGNVKIGVISVHSPDYDAKHWWRYSQGIEDVAEQGFAYLYARLFFSPSS